MSRSRSTRAPDLEEVQSRFEQWRQTRQRKAAIPDELWAAAAWLVGMELIGQLPYYTWMAASSNGGCWWLGIRLIPQDFLDGFCQCV